MTTVFTLVDAVVLRPLPVAAPDELVSLRYPSFSYPMFEQIRDRGHMLRGVFAWEPRTLHAAWTSEPEPTSMLLVTGAFHDTLGLQPSAGRLLNQADVGNTAAEAQAVAVLSYAAWQRRFNGDPAAIGRTLRIEGQPFTIVGVTPPGFFGVAVGMSPDVTIPVTMLPRLRSDERDALVNADSFWLNIMGRVRSGMSIAQADAAFQPVWAQALAATLSPDWTANWRARYVTFTSGLEPGASGYSPRSTSVPGRAVAAVRPGRAGAGRRLRDGGQPAARGRGRAPPGTGAAARHRRRSRAPGSAAVPRGPGAGRRGRRARRSLLDLGRGSARAAALDQLRPRDDGARRRRPRARVHGGRHRHRGARLQPRADRQGRPHRSWPGSQGGHAPGGRRSPARRHRASAGRRAGRTVDGPAGGLGALRAQPDPVADERRGLRPRWPSRGQRRRAVAGERALGSRRSGPGSRALVRRVAAAPAGHARGALGEPVAEAADQQRAGILVRHLQRRRTTGG